MLGVLRNNRSVLLPDRDYAREGEWCVSGGHVVLVPVVPMASIVMRGMMPLSVLNSTRSALHGTRVTYFEAFSRDPHLGGSPTGAGSNVTVRLARHFELYGPPTACIILKYSSPESREACASRGAVTLLDCIDNHRCFHDVNVRDFARYSALIVQTAVHR